MASIARSASRSRHSGDRAARHARTARGHDLTQAFDDAARGAWRASTPLVRFLPRPDDAGVLDRVEIAVPGDRAREQ
jgi:hypothetical protein